MNVDLISCGVIADFTVEPLANLLRNDGTHPRIEVVPTPPGHVWQALLELREGRWGKNPDLVVVWTKPEIVPGFRSLLQFVPVESAALLRQVDQFADLLTAAATHVHYLLMVTWSLPWYRRGLGLLSMRGEFGWAQNLARMNLRLAERVRQNPKVYLLDSARWLSKVGAEGNNPKPWYQAKMAFSLAVLREAAADIKAAVGGLAGLSRKLILLDLDGTLWGGIVGEDGWQNLRLGGHDPFGEAFVEFQGVLKDLTQAGVLLGIVSKNDEATALAAIDNHPEMVLRREDFAGWRINWRDKAENIVDLVGELHLGLDSVVFLDDNPAERSRVREALPKVLVPEWPTNPMLYAQALLEMRAFDRPSLTGEDQKRAQSYASNRERRSFQSAKEWQATLGLVVEAGTLEESNLPRATQLLNKTNQMNLRTRRLTQTEFLEWSRQAGHSVFVFRVSDRFADYGLTGLASFQETGTHAQITDFLLSCRVLGYGVETAILHFLVEEARRRGMKEVIAEYEPTERNAPCLAFWTAAPGFHRDGHTFRWNAPDPCALPQHITLRRCDSSSGLPQHPEAAHALAAPAFVSE